MHIAQSLSIKLKFGNPQLGIFVLYKHSKYYEASQHTKLPYILESNTHPGFGDLLNGKKLVRDSNTHLSFNHPMPTWQLTE
jgi:hypothetical protein